MCTWLDDNCACMPKQRYLTGGYNLAQPSVAPGPPTWLCVTSTTRTPVRTSTPDTASASSARWLSPMSNCVRMDCALCGAPGSQQARTFIQ